MLQLWLKILLILASFFPNEGLILLYEYLVFPRQTLLIDVLIRKGRSWLSHPCSRSGRSEALLSTHTLCKVVANILLPQNPMFTSV